MKDVITVISTLSVIVFTAVGGSTALLSKRIDDINSDIIQLRADIKDIKSDINLLRSELVQGDNLLRADIYNVINKLGETNDRLDKLETKVVKHLSTPH